MTIAALCWRQGGESGWLDPLGGRDEVSNQDKWTNAPPCLRFDLALWDTESLASSVGLCRDCVLGACVAIFSSLHWKLTDCQFDMRWPVDSWRSSGKVTIFCFYRNNRIMLDDFVICKMPSVFLAPGIPVSSGGSESLVTISPWAFILPLLLISLVIIIILYNVNCQLRCSSYLSSLNFSSAKLLEGETSVWLAPNKILLSPIYLSFQFIRLVQFVFTVYQVFIYSLRRKNVTKC